MNQYDELINQADMAVIDDTIVERESENYDLH
jgi:hypothetical protein